MSRHWRNKRLTSGKETAASFLGSNTGNGGGHPFRNHVIIMSQWFVHAGAKGVRLEASLLREKAYVKANTHH